MSVPFTAARARNAGLAEVADTNFIQFLDGDCALQPDWLNKARAHLEAHPKTAVVCGRRRERHPEASIYNAMTDMEWDTPIGPAKACGGDALMRRDALTDVGGYDPSLIAGEEPEMCVRLRAKGWDVYRLDAEMTLHDADMHRFGQWWKRTQRAGHAYAEGAAMHGAAPERHNMPELKRIVFWGMALPVLAFVGALFHSAALLILMAYPLQVLRLRLRGEGWPRAFFFTIGKLAEAQGALQYYVRKGLGRRSTLIEYK
jgi:GT2 family glycosyltransferase